MNINQLSRTPLLSRTNSHRILPSRYLNRSKCPLLKFRTVTLFSVLFPPLNMLNSTISCSHQSYSWTSLVGLSKTFLIQAPGMQRTSLGSRSGGQTGTSVPQQGVSHHCLPVLPQGSCVTGSESSWTQVPERPLLPGH